MCEVEPSESPRRGRLPPPAGVRWSPELSLGAVIQALVVIGSVAVWAGSSSGRSEQTQRDLASLRTDLTAQISDLRTRLDSAVTELRTDVRAVPSRLDNVDKWIAAHEQRSTATEGRLADLERQEAETRVIVDTLRNGLNAPLLPRRP